MLALWRSYRRRQRNPDATWLTNLIVRAVPLSLRFVNTLFYYWTGDRGVVDGVVKATIRQSVVNTFRATIRSGETLVRVLAKEYPYEVGGFITQNGSQEVLGAFAEWSDHLAPLLVDAARPHPDTVLPQIANLAGDEQSGIRAAGVEPPVFINRYRIDREHLRVLFDNQLDEVLVLLADYAGTDVYALRAKEDAKAWLAERRVAAE